LIVVVHIGNIEIRPSIVPNLILLVFCFFYLKDLMKNKPTVVLVQSSAFWLVMGIFFSSCIGFPVSALIPFISKSEQYSNLRFQIFSVQNMSLIIMYLFIIKSYLCLKHPQHS
jgi:RsiW-degrading membrane proteinase PrsW (M82 family)